MPLDIVPDPPHPSARVGAPSAAVELGSVYCRAAEARVQLPDGVEAGRSFWHDDDDAYPFLTELMALAHATGHLEDPRPDALLERLREPVVFDGPLPLETETPAERDVTNRRLRRLATDRRMRLRYVAVLSGIWAAIADEWNARGLPAATRAQHDWAARLAAGTDVLELIPEPHLAHREERYGAMVRRAQRDGTLVLTPSATGRHIIALPGILSVSALATGEDPVVARRRSADEIAARLRPLADGTRLTMIAQLGIAPCGVSELARTLHIAQPTASVHLRRLREAGIVEAARDGARTVYRVRPGAVDELLGEVASRVARATGTPAAH